MALSRDVIPIRSRQPAAPSSPPAAPEASIWRRAGLVLLGGVALVASVGLLGLLAVQGSRTVARLPEKQRGAIFARAHRDLLETCSLPEAADGPIREHCLQQARFVLQFPECDEDCARAARAVLPRATR